MSHLVLKILATWMIYCTSHQLPCKITSTKEHYIGFPRISRTHEQGRAIDVSVRGWTKSEIKAVIKEIYKKHQKIGAISYSDGVQRPVILHAGSALHLHLQSKE